MKTLIAALIIVSGSAFAGVVPANEYLLSVLPAGSYTGSYNGKACSVSVTDLGDRVEVVGQNNSTTGKRTVLNSSSYFPFRGARTFLSSDVTNSRRGRKENFVRTLAVSQNTQYVAVGDIFQADYPNGDRENVVECVINL